MKHSQQNSTLLTYSVDMLKTLFVNLKYNTEAKSGRGVPKNSYR